MVEINPLSIRQSKFKMKAFSRHMYGDWKKVNRHKIGNEMFLITLGLVTKSFWSPHEW
jgi:hypothetical protein